MTDLTLISAGAGSGKTHRIKTDLSDWVRKGEVRPERILAVTFTEAAAGELRRRIKSALIDDGNLEAALAIDRAYVSTIHGLGHRILVEHAFAAGTSPQQRLISEEEQDLLIRRSVEESEELSDLSRQLKELGYRASYGSNTSAEDSFRGAVMKLIGLLRSLGPRGSDPILVDQAEKSVRERYGKTQGQADTLRSDLLKAAENLLKTFPSSLAELAETATSKAAEKDFREDFQRLQRGRRQLSSGVDDWADWQRLRKLRQTKRGSPTPTGYDEAASAVIAAADRLANHPGPLEDAVRHARLLVEGAQAAMGNYAKRKRELGVLDFADMVAGSAELLEQHQDVRDAVLGEVDCVVIDEFQDTNPIQFSFLWTLARNAKRCLIVGDTKQAIMGFQGADPRLTEELNSQFSPDALEQNWRSDPRIMEFINGLGPCLFGENYEELTATRSAGSKTALEILELGATRGSRGAKPQHFIADRVLSLLEDEDSHVVDRHSKMLRSLEPRDIALLCPTHSMCQNYAAALRELGLNVRLAESGWWTSPVIQAATFAMRYAADPQDMHAALCLAALGPDKLPLEDALRQIAEDGRPELAVLENLRAIWPASLSMSVDQLAHEVIRTCDLRQWCDHLEDPAQMRADLLRLEAEASDFIEAHRDMREAAGFYGEGALVFLGWLENMVGTSEHDRRPNPSGTEADGIEIVTWHSSKGREWPITVVCGLDKNNDPRLGEFSTHCPDYSKLEEILERSELNFAPKFDAPEASDRFLDHLSPEAEQNCRRLLYVALTRARDRLIIEWPKVNSKKDERPPITAHRLLAEDCKLVLKGNQVSIGEKEFPCRCVLTGKEMPGSFDLELGNIRSEKEVWAPRHSSIKRQSPDFPEIFGPSRALTANSPAPADLETVTLAEGVVLEDKAFALATEKGNVVHEALRILLMKPEFFDRVGAHCGLSDGQVESLSIQAEALRIFLNDHGYHTLHCEQPVEIRLSDGGTLSAVIDLLAEGDEGYFIVDHKSGPVADHEDRFRSYWPQLNSYIEAVAAFESGPVNAIGVLWVNDGTLTWSIPNKSPA